MARRRNRASDDSAKVTGELLFRFLRDVPWLALIWLGVTVLICGIGAVTGGTSLREALSLAVGFLPMAVPLSPLVWLRWEAIPPRRAVLPAVGIAIAWFVLLLLPAALIGSWLATLVGG
jgi:hypothetical protein